TLSAIREQHGGVVVSLVDSPASSCPLFLRHLDRLARSPKESRALPNSSMMTSVTINEVTLTTHYPKELQRPIVIRSINNEKNIPRIVYQTLFSELKTFV
ncbi:hypothetical protein L9F63_016403, partial [Diploptera punctata]